MIGKMKSNSYLSLPSTLSTFKKHSNGNQQPFSIRDRLKSSTICLYRLQRMCLWHINESLTFSPAGKLIVSFDFLSSVVLPHAAIQRTSIGSSYAMRKTRPVRISPIDQSYKIRHTAMRHLPPLKSCHLDGTHL